jgi:hypothetical protein
LVARLYRPHNGSLGLPHSAGKLAGCGGAGNDSCRNPFPDGEDMPTLDPRHDDNGKLMPRSNCPMCHKSVDAATAAEGILVRPNPGDISICFYCGEVLTFDPQMQLVPCDLNGMLALTEDQRQLVGLMQSRIRLRNAGRM